MSDRSDDSEALREMQDFLSDEGQLLRSLDAVLTELREEAHAHAGDGLDRNALWGRIARDVSKDE